MDSRHFEFRSVPPQPLILKVWLRPCICVKSADHIEHFLLLFSWRCSCNYRQPSGICSWYALYMYGHCVPTYSCAKRRTKACTIIVVLCTSAVGDWALSIYVYCLCDRRQLHKTEVTYRTCANSMVGVTWRGHSPHAFSVQWREPACLLHCCCTDIVVLWVALDRDTARFCSREVNVNEHIALIIGC